MSLQIRELCEADWPQVWPIVREVVRAGDTYTYDPHMSADEAYDTWLTPPPGRTVVVDDVGMILGTAHMGPNRSGPGGAARDVRRALEQLLREQLERLPAARGRARIGPPAR